MKDLYHFSHFFEFLCGVYFGGFALLSFLEEDVLASFEFLLKGKGDHAATSKALSTDYFKMHTTTPAEGTMRFAFFGTCWFLYSMLEKFFNLCFKISNFFITSIGTSKDKEFLKKFFPGFFFTGCFCLMTVLLSAFQLENDNKACYEAVNRFLLYYSIFCLLFQIWSLTIFPFLVNRIDYFHLIFFNILFCVAICILAFVYAKDDTTYFDLGWILQDNGKEWLKLTFIIISLIPLFFIIAISILTILCWELSVIFYIISIYLFKQKAVDIDNDIKL